MASEIDDLSQAVASWLSYKSLTGLRGLLNEGSMQVPISEFLSTNSKELLHAEHRHPLFSTGEKGRPKQLDYVKTRKGSGKNWISVYECKYQTDTPQRIIDDLCRLLVLAQCRKEVGTPKRYFLFAGKRTSIDEYLDIKINSGTGKRISLFEKIFNREVLKKPKNLKVRLSDLKPNQIRFFLEFCKSYSKPIPSMFETKLETISTAGNYACSIWSIKSSKGSKLLDMKAVSDMERQKRVV